MTELQNYLKPLTDKNAHTVTEAKIKRAESGNMKDTTTNKLYHNMAVACSETRPNNKPETVNW